MAPTLQSAIFFRRVEKLRYDVVPLREGPRPRGPQGNNRRRTGSPPENAAGGGACATSFLRLSRILWHSRPRLCVKSGYRHVSAMPRLSQSLFFAAGGGYATSGHDGALQGVTKAGIPDRVRNDKTVEATWTALSGLIVRPA